MNYYEGDYRAIGYAPAACSIISKLGASAAPLYNGNIAAMSVNIPVLGGGAKVYNYKYDQLNRIVSMDLFDGLAIGNSGYSLSQQQAYKERVSYDPNGNILRYVRNGPSTGLAMDSLIYGYTAGSNRLHKVVDSITHANAYSDIKPGQADNNYKYDEIGNLISDNSEGITSVSWNVYGKITQIVKSTGTIKYTYDASGNRVMKITPSDTTVYVRDASGNVMAVYTATGTLSLAEMHLYGSSRLGMVTKQTVSDVILAVGGDFGDIKKRTFTRGEKLFELSNHLGNVLVTITDRRQQVSAGGSTVDSYLADINTANDYYPFGMLMPNRSYTAGNQFRYGFNGKENDNDVKGAGNQQDYGMRIYDPRIGKFLSVDPLTKKYPYYTPYQFSGNSPIANIDMDGLEEVHYIFVWVKSASGKEVVLKLGGVMIGTPTGKVDKNGIIEYKEPYKIYAHYPAEAYGEIYLVTATYNSEEEFQNAKAKDFYKDAILVGANKGAEIAMHFGDLMAIGYITTSLAAIGKEALALYVDQKLAQYSANLVNKRVLQELISQNIKLQILKSTGLTAEAKLAAIEAGTEGAHFLSRHGAQTTLKQQFIRATTGLTPDGVMKRPMPSTRFWTHEIELEALEIAQASYKKGMEETGFIFDLGKSAGEGYYRGGKSYGTSSLVQVFYNSSGEVISIHPLLPKK